MFKPSFIVRFNVPRSHVIFLSFIIILFKKTEAKEETEGDTCFHFGSARANYKTSKKKRFKRQYNFRSAINIYIIDTMKIRAYNELMLKYSRVLNN